MAKYDYGCPRCKYEGEYEHSVNDKPVLYCPRCSNSNLKRAMKKIFKSAPGVKFKGGGWTPKFHG